MLPVGASALLRTHAVCAALVHSNSTRTESYVPIRPHPEVHARSPPRRLQIQPPQQRKSHSNEGIAPSVLSDLLHCKRDLRQVRGNPAQNCTRDWKSSALSRANGATQALRAPRTAPMIPTLSRLASRMRVGQAHCSLARRSRHDQDPRAHPHVPNDNPFSEAQLKTLKYRPDFPARFGSIRTCGPLSRLLLPVQH